MSKALPSAFERFFGKGTELVAHDSIADALRNIVRQGTTIYDWAADQPQPRALRGRAPVYVATLPGGDTIAVRHAWHGGLLAPITRDLWIAPPRAAQELRKSVALQNGGIHTAPVLGYAAYSAGPRLVRVDVVSQYLDNTFDLAAVFSGLAPGIDHTQATEAVRVLLRHLEVQHLVHPDLNAKNILIRKTAGNPVAYVIDVDVMRHRPGTDRSSVRIANTARLMRSLQKLRQQLDTQQDFLAGIMGILANVPFEPDPVLAPIVDFNG